MTDFILFRHGPSTGNRCGDGRQAAVQRPSVLEQNSPTLTYQFDVHLLQVLSRARSARVGQWAQSSDLIVWVH